MRHTEECADERTRGGDHSHCDSSRLPIDGSTDGTDKSTYCGEGNEADPLENIINFIRQKVLHNYSLFLMRFHDLIIHMCTGSVESQFIVVMVIYIIDLLLIGRRTRMTFYDKSPVQIFESVKQ